MHPILEVLKKIRAKAKSPIFVDVEQYLETGDKKTLARIKTSGNWSYFEGWHTWSDTLSAPFSLEDPKDEVQLRYLDVLVQCGYWGDWIVPMSHVFEKEKATEDFFSLLLASFRKCKKSEIELADHFWGSRIEPTNVEGKPNSGARYYLAMSDSDFKNLVKSMSHESGMRKLAPFLLQFAPKRLDLILEDLIYEDATSPKTKNQRFFYPAEYFLLDSIKVILEKTGKKYAKRIFKTWSGIKMPIPKYNYGYEMIAVDPVAYREPTRRVALEMIATNTFEEWHWKLFVEEYGLDHVELVCDYLQSKANNGYCVSHMFESALEKLGPKMIPLIEAALENAMPTIRLIATQSLVELGDSRFDDLAERRFVQEFATGQETLKFLLLAKKWNPARLVESFWKLLGNKSKPVREAAARTLGAFDAIDIDRVEKLLFDKKADNRDSAVNILAQLTAQSNGAAAIKLLESRLDVEENDDIRDKILAALESAWEAQGKKITMKTIRERIARAAPKSDKFKVKWLDVKKLPPLRADKKKLDENTVRYLLYRQSRCKEMRADVEAKPLVAMIDRATSGDFALAVLGAFLASKTEPADRWALAIAGLLGDDRIVPLLSKRIQLWADSARGKMSEYAVQALALLGTETALTVVNSMTIRYRTKYKNIGTAAEEAFRQAAELRGISADELGDSVVPKLGFEFGKPRIWTINGKEFDIRLGTDFKVEIFDVAKGKKVASLPKPGKSEMTEKYGTHSQELLKEIKDTLKEVVKGQLLRIENMLVRQYRWPIGDWVKLYQHHPVLRPFTVRLVWGLYDGKGKLKSTFRALEDGSLTDAADETVKLPKAGKIGIVHPLELSVRERDDWRRHLLDFEIVQPFPQLERSVVVPTDEEKSQTVSKKWYGTQLNAMTFKGRAEKLGWRRGSVCDGGWISTYWKAFPEAGADAFLGIDNFYIGISMDEQVTLRDLCFVQSGSVQIGSYVYDDPGEGDTRIIPFGDVPPIVFSEVMGDMRKIAPDQKES